MSNKILQVKHLSKSFGSNVVLRISIFPSKRVM